MTMQIAMVGDDGIVLASDMLHVAYDLPGGVPRKPISGTKIEISDGRDVAVSCAHNMDTAREIAERLIKATDQEWERPQISFATIASVITSQAGERDDAQCLIVSSRSGSPQAFFVADSCVPVERWEIAGDTNNAAAIFLASAYYSELYSVQQLVSLAALVIVGASKVNSGAIGGLEIVVCDRDGCHRLDSECTRSHMNRAEKWYADTNELIVRCTEQLAYAPNVIS